MSGERCKMGAAGQLAALFGCAARSVEFDAHINGGERQDQIEALDPQDLVTALNHGWCRRARPVADVSSVDQRRVDGDLRREPIRLTRPDVSLVFVLLEHEVGHEARQSQVFSGLVAKVDLGS